MKMLERAKLKFDSYLYKPGSSAYRPGNSFGTITKAAMIRKDTTNALVLFFIGHSSFFTKKYWLK